MKTEYKQLNLKIRLFFTFFRARWVLEMEDIAKEVEQRENKSLPIKGR